MLKTPSFLNRDDVARDNRMPAARPVATPPPAAPAPAAPPSAAKSEPVAAREISPADATGIGNRLIVGPEVKLKGAEIDDCDTLIVEGRVEATLDSRIIRVAEQGSFNGTVGVNTAEIRGRFDGELTARNQLFIHAGGHVSGKIRYGKILIEEGGQISGDVQAIAAKDASSFNAVKEKPVMAMT